MLNANVSSASVADLTIPFLDVRFAGYRQMPNNVITYIIHAYKA
jgi:hypothetical protein